MLTDTAGTGCIYCWFGWNSCLPLT